MVVITLFTRGEKTWLLLYLNTLLELEHDCFRTVLPNFFTFTQQAKYNTKGLV